MVCRSEGVRGVIEVCLAGLAGQNIVQVAVCAEEAMCRLILTAYLTIVFVVFVKESSDESRQHN